MSPESPTLALLVPAAGLGRRMGAPRHKPFLDLDGKSILCHSLDRFRPFRHRIVQTIVLVHPDDLPAARRDLGPVLTDTYGVTHLVAGGARRQDTVRIGLDLVAPDAKLVAIHDAVRPFVSPSAIAACLDAAARVGAAIVAAPLKPTVKRAAAGRIAATIDRRDLWGAQTPQIFRRALIREAYAAAERDALVVTDDASVVEHLGRPVALVAGSDLNLKITTPEDLRVAHAILAAGLIDA